MIYTYLLCDDGGVSNSENEILLPLKSIFRHEYGTYEVINWRTDSGEITTRYSDITQVECERIKK
ncbi:MAG: hypothetical protein JWQ09_5821 [Segetibacter sp.]|nr:hypothetical protein [Segetibacter sp.]